YECVTPKSRAVDCPDSFQVFQAGNRLAPCFILVHAFFNEKRGLFIKIYTFNRGKRTWIV
ncbi:hypothetical protein, partial [Pseudomonas sp. MPBD7-1]|uniref:hypothetical protein n=1 Tax=Pseudomonas sp. MPBD7-1 TaxID=2075549 RepID=UPI001C4645C6